MCAGLSSSDLLKSVEITKPMASVSPVVQKDSSAQDSSQAASIAASCSSGTSTPMGSGKEPQTDSDKTLVNGPSVSAAGCDSPDSMPFSNGPVPAEVGVKSGAVSLLNHAPNGEIGRTPSDSAGTVKTRSNSLDSAPVNVVKVSWPSGDKMTGSTSPSITSKGKNIVISAINKANNTVITKVVSSPGSQGGKPFSNSATVKSVGSSASPTSILSPRHPQSIVRTPANITASVNSVSSASTSASKVITVTSTPQGKRVTLCVLNQFLYDM